MFEKKKQEPAKQGKEPAKEGEKQLTMEEIVADNKELLDLLQRLQAEFENYKKREEKNKEEFAKYCNVKIFQNLLSIMDSFESALEKNPESKEAIEPLYYQLKSLLEKNNVKQFSAMNEKFNPELHEATQTGFNPDKDEGIILEELKKGYYLHDKVLRHSQVKTNKKPTEKIEEIKKQLKQQLEELKAEKPQEKIKEEEMIKDKEKNKEALQNA